MKLPLKKNLRTTLALGALAVALIATVVSGREKPGTDLVAAPAERAAAQLSAQRSAQEAGDIDLDKLQRPKKEVSPAVELFGAPDPQHAGANAHGKSQPRAVPPPEPPLPFQYLGKVIDEGKLSVFLMSGSAHYSVQQGETVIKQYRVDRITDAAVTFTYLPTGTQKVLAVPPVN